MLIGVTESLGPMLSVWPLHGCNAKGLAWCPHPKYTFQAEVLEFRVLVGSDGFTSGS